MASATMALAFRMEEAGRVFVYASDVGYPETGPTPDAIALYQGAHVLLHDSTYRPADQITRRNRGFSSYEDACAAADAGAQGIVVSNHGGRQLDGAPSSISALPRIVEAVGGRLEILMDGGVHSGQDVVKAVALGARAVMIGRAWVYALAARGETGVRHLLSQMQREISVTLALTGLTRVSAANPGILLTDGTELSARDVVGIESTTSRLMP
jgi:hypothetical protein